MDKELLKEINETIDLNIVFDIFNNYKLDLNGTHGIYHWARVIENGLIIAKKNGANKKVVILFGFFHDCQRWNESTDPFHGKRGADFSTEFKEKLRLSTEEMDLFYEACEKHTNFIKHDNLTIATCFDADRLDLRRLGIFPDQKLNPNA